ncbi:MULTISPECIES: TetR/AcrR family transcriptional regulator [Actinosynnema]|uniref:TetR/AcrR family transcriptional regulator n=1 Tax=Actinosynnema TaxID=40566 RepID=UPI0020A54F22|nr:TetR/AcrR family transcriptional regulator [Actinosynnema pretiosum]MCP2098205.1 transcriptional regulator, TetR family [Actinosynnema pretiosum]
MIDGGARRGRADKRTAILAAAFRVFAARGYAQACVRDIADEAGVAKPTVYNHLTDKESLFRESLLAAADRARVRLDAALDGLRAPGDPAVALARAVGELAEVLASDEVRSLRLLALGNAALFPELVGEAHRRTSAATATALADRLARLVLSGALRRCEPDRAAGHLLSLVDGALDARSAWGSRELPAAEARAAGEDAVEVFLLAYGGQASE